MKSYKQWSANDRVRMSKLSKKAIADGEIPKPAKCNRCGRKEGEVTMQYHNHDYSHPTDHLEPVCKGCHFMLHKRFSEPVKSAEYFERLWLKRYKENINDPSNR